MILPVILAGGSGERLWPLSRTAYPKQFLSLLGAKHSLFQATIQRLTTATNFLPPLIICHEEYRFIIAEQLRAINTVAAGIILEPSANNTAPAIALAAHWAQQKYQNPLLLILPADHFIQDNLDFQRTINQAVLTAQQNYLITFGIQITKPETGYGYIQTGSKITDSAGYNVAKFIEKPDAATAEILFKDTTYLWNSGMFLFTAASYLRELEKFQPAIIQATKDAISSRLQDLDFIRPQADCYRNCPAISIDYAVMEHTDKAAVFALKSAWSDIGSWQAVWEHGAKDAQGNFISGDVVAKNSSNCLIDARHRLVTTLDIHDLAIIETADAILVTKLDQSQELKKLVTELKHTAHPAASEHRQVRRPWGWYDSVAKGDRFQVKHIFVDPGKSLSLQLHHHRSEHWIIVQGSAKILRGSEVFILSENESTFIPIGVKHQLTNIGKIALELIEVQSGSYLGEDDIVRFADEHGRTTVSDQEYV